jgi:hypothetical protein
MSFHVMHEFPIFFWLARMSAALVLRSVPARAAGAVDEEVVVELTFVVPPDAQVFFDAEPAVQKGGERLLLTRPRQVGK